VVWKGNVILRYICGGLALAGHQMPTKAALALPLFGSTEE